MAAKNALNVSAKRTDREEMKQLYNQFRAEVKEVDLFFCGYYERLLGAVNRPYESRDSRLSGLA